MISIKHKTIFIHIPKCAGQSIEYLFLKDLGEINLDNRFQLLLRPKKFNERGPERLAHLYSEEYFKFNFISKTNFENYFKFSIVRDPIERIVSELNFLGVPKLNSKNNKLVNSVKEYISNANHRSKYTDIYRHICPQINYLFDSKSKKLLVDEIFYLGDINTKLPSFLKKKFKNFDGIPKINSSSSNVWNKNELTKSDLNFINEFYKKDYQFIGSLLENKIRTL